MFCLELVEIAHRMMSSTPRDKGMGWASIYHVIPKSFSDTRDFFGISLYILSLHFWLRKDQGFAALFGIHVALCVDGVLLSVYISCYVYHFPSLIFCN